MTSLANSIKNSLKKELNNKCTRKLNKDILVDAGLNMTGKRLKKEFDRVRIQE